MVNNQISVKDKAGLGYDSQMNESEVVHSIFNSRESDVDDSLVNDRFKTDNSVYKTKLSKTETSISKTSKDIVEKPKTVRLSAPIIEDWDTDSDNDSVFRPKSNQTKPKITKINFVKSEENTHTQVEYPRKSQSPKDNKRNWNGMMTDKPKSKNAKVRVNTEESAVKPEPELKNTIECNLNPSDGPGKPNSIILKTVKTKWALNQLQQPICVQLTKTVKAQS
ncbi:hypothetical protein Tco_1402601 [Tanacetum coccineum]